MFEEKADAPIKEKGTTDNTAKIISFENSKLKFYKFGIAAGLLLFVSSLLCNLKLQQKIKSVHNEVARLSASKTLIADELKIQKAFIVAMNIEMQIISDPNNKKITLKGMNSLHARSAAIHWNMLTNEVYFNASELPQPANKRYQVWAIVDSKPIDAGIINLNYKNVFQKMKNIAGAQTFAVTIEAPGGSAKPSLETMCLLGNV